MKNSAANPPSEPGYLLVEVMVTATLLLVGLLAVMPLLTLAMRQNALAKDTTVASSLASDRIEQFLRMPCSAIRRGTCCTLSDPPPVALSGGACADDNRTVDRIVYERRCNIRQSVASTTYTNDSDASAHDFPAAGLAWLEVTVTPRRGRHLAGRAVKPTVVSVWRVCEP